MWCRIVCGLMVTLLCTECSEAQPAQRFDLLITEFFPDPSPSVGLPNSEFIELKNNAGRPINLKNWKISDGSSTATFSTNFILGIDSFLILCPTSAVPGFTPFGTCLGVAGFPSLNNDADQIFLYSPEGRLVHSLQYDDSWYQNDLKKEGGWSLEMIDPKNPCNGASNWIASTAAIGGSPGKKNSVDGNNPDEQSPVLLRSYAEDSTHLILVFDESLDSSSAAIASRYTINSLQPLSALCLPPFFTSVRLQLADKLVKGQVYTLSANAITDCARNPIGSYNTTRVGLTDSLSKEDLVINEILFNPFTDGSDYIELYNKSRHIIDISQLYIANRNSTGTLINMVKLYSSPYLFYPGDFLTFTKDRKIVLRQYVVKDPLSLIEMGSFPSMPDDQGQVVLLNKQGQVLDEVDYDEDWHFPLLSSKDGVALERMDYQQPSNDKTNWGSAAATAGFGTPTYRNSQQYAVNQLAGSFTINPAIFSPDNDGYNDYVQLQYQFTQNNLVGNLTLFDVQGRVVKRLVNQLTLAQKGSFRWDGMDELNQPVSSGIYIALFEVFGLNGKTQRFKKTLSLYRRSR